MTAEPIREATDAELDAKMLRELRTWVSDCRKLGPSSGYAEITVEELDLLLRIADERDAVKRAFVEPIEAPSPYLVLSCHYCGHATHGAGFLCHDDNRCTCRGGL